MTKLTPKIRKEAVRNDSTGVDLKGSVIKTVMTVRGSISRGSS